MDILDIDTNYQRRFMELIETMGWKISTAAEILDVSVSFLTQIKNGQRAFSLEMLMLIHQKTRVNLHWFLTGEGTMFSAAMPPLLSSVQKDVKEIKELVDKLAIKLEVD